MKYPTLTEIATNREMVDAFRGYNHNLRISEGEFYDMQNLTSTHYPVLSPRGKRGVYSSPANPQGLIAKDALCYVADGKFYIDKYPINGLSLSDSPKSLVSMGAYVVIFPDKKWVNTANYNATTMTFDEDGGYGDIDAAYETLSDEEGAVWTKFTLCKADGSSYGDFTSSDSEPTSEDEIPNGTLWLDTSSSPHALKMYSSNSGMWVSIATTYIKIESAGIDKAFEKYDGINIAGLGEGVVLNDHTASGAEIKGTVRDQLADLEGSAAVWAKGDNYIVIVGILDEEKIISNKISITRKMPEVDYVIESNNRLWGCRYGLSNNGEFVNEIYVSKQGDFKNWNCFMGLSTDSYVASCGTDGKFTGAVTHLGYPLFFKENCMHKVYGNYPANYQIQTTACRGVQDGCSKSLAIVNEVLYYKSRTGVCAYDGSLPAEVSYALGNEVYSNAVACGHGNKYYISMQDILGKYHLFAYDTSKGMWHREDNTQVDLFCPCRGEVYFLSEGVIKTLFGSGTQDTTPVEWMAETGIIGAGNPDKKYVSRLTLRMAAEYGSRVDIYIDYDSEGVWNPVASLNGITLKTFAIPIRTRRCDHLRMRIVGKGEAKIFSIVKTIEQGSDA